MKNGVLHMAGTWTWGTCDIFVFGSELLTLFGAAAET